MKYGTINCQCGQVFYFETMSPITSCPSCKNEYDIISYPEKIKESEIEEIALETIEMDDSNNPDKLYKKALSRLEHSLDISAGILDATLKGLGHTLVKREEGEKPDGVDI